MNPNKKPVNNIRNVDGSVSVRLKSSNENISFGRHFEEKDTLVSAVHISLINLSCQDNQ